MNFIYSMMTPLEIAYFQMFYVKEKLNQQKVHCKNLY